MKHNIAKIENSCATCRFGMDDTNPGTNICRAGPPVILMSIQGEMSTRWPLTGLLQVCGQFERGERRVLLDEMVVTPTSAPDPAQH